MFEKRTSGAVPHGGRSWGTALGETPTVGSTSWWGQAPDAASQRCGPRRQEPAYKRGRAPTAGPLTPPSKPSAFNPSEHF
jgi:hypothetical protein